ncbi:NlpC/P60 family protein [Caulobacter sp. FWC2]|uniref:NlpC/P60 family protein n=1 Tax=Caulobacter sp. FWC2 TaxID=69664 RepID=UPI000C15C353|nr:NlpC/P60 family protein [Caulobacter sp. FWC2]PIB90953.1 peptidase [Caulobacter sp. FWC2]
MRGSCRPRDRPKVGPRINSATEGASWTQVALAPSGPLGHLPRIAGEDLVAHARLWLGTPYRHQTSTLHAGCDCLGLVRGVWRALHGTEPEPPPPYRPDWAETGGRELLLEAFARWLIPIDAPIPGDVLVFRMAPGAVAKHCAIQSAPDRMIHAYWGRACVESALGRWWRERLVAAFRFPQI